MSPAPRQLLAWLLLPACIVLLLVSCGGDDDGDVAASPTVRPTSAPTQTSDEPARSLGVLVVDATQVIAFDFTPDGRLFFTERTTGEIRIAVATSRPMVEATAARQAINLARSDYALLADAEVSDVELISLATMDWPDTCLGLGEPGEVCEQAVTPGYQITLTISGSSGAAVYRTDAGTTVRLGAIQVVTRGESDLFASVEVFHGSECGLLGIALDPDFETNH